MIKTGRGRIPVFPNQPPKRPRPKEMPKKQGFKEKTEETAKPTRTYGPNPKHFRKGKGR